MNKKNLHFWAPENLHFIHQQPLHSEKVTVQCALGITRPWFFKMMGPDLLLIWLNSFVCMNVIETKTVTTNNSFTCLVPAGRCNCASLQTHQWEFLDACFLDILSRVLAILLDLPGFPTYRCVIFFMGISEEPCLFGQATKFWRVEDYNHWGNYCLVNNTVNKYAVNSYGM